MKKFLIWTGVILFILISIGVFAGSEESPTTASPTSDSATEAQQDPEWRTIGSWSGSGMSNTEPFTVNSDRWRIVWQSRASGFAAESGGAGHILQIYVHKPGNALPEDLAANIANVAEESGGHNVYSSGDYYLKISGANGNWSVRAQVLE